VLPCVQTGSAGFRSWRPWAWLASAGTGFLSVASAPLPNLPAVSAPRRAPNLINYIAREPEMAREMTSRWISEVPSKMV
jgi:hypothetical protein